MTLLSDASHEEKAPLEETRARWQTVTGQQAGTFGVATIANNPTMRGMVFDRKPVVEVVKIGSEGDGDIVADLLKEMMQNKRSTFIAIYFFLRPTDMRIPVRQNATATVMDIAVALTIETE